MIESSTELTRGVTAVAKGGKVKLLRLSRERVTLMLGSLSEALSTSMQMQLLERIDITKNLPLNSRKYLLQRLEAVTFEDGTQIVKQGEKAAHFYIIVSGSARVSSCVSDADSKIKEQMDIATLVPDDFFGERALVTGTDRMASVFALGQVELLRLSKEHFDAVLKPTSVMRQTMSERDSEVKDISSAHVHFRDLEQGTVLGVGSFGYVRLSKHKPTGQTFALKAMHKAHIIKTKQEAHIINERRIAYAVDHPNLLSLLESYQDNDHIYMLTELLQGGELFSLLMEFDVFDEAMTRFYFAQVVSGFSALHQVGIVYRDLKPENLMLDTAGYLRIVDYGFAKLVGEALTYTLCGTPEYLSPEVVQNKGHGLPTDWWSAGVLLYELLNGTSPFARDSQMELMKAIVRVDYSLPAEIESSQAAPLIRRLLVLDPALRLGSGQTKSAEVVADPFFASIDWDQLFNKQMPAPWKPKISGSLDTSRFDDFGEDEKPWNNINLGSIGVADQKAFIEF